MLKKWEYISKQMYNYEIEGNGAVSFNTIGKKGWELVSVTQFTPIPIELGEGHTSIFTAFFKREKID